MSKKMASTSLAFKNLIASIALENSSTTVSCGCLLHNLETISLAAESSSIIMQFMVCLLKGFIYVITGDAKNPTWILSLLQKIRDEKSLHDLLDHFQILPLLHNLL